MTAEEWSPLARRIGTAWPNPGMDTERRDLYLEILRDLTEADVGAAVDALLRDDRELQPPPGVIRARAVAIADARVARSSPHPPPPLPSPPPVPPLVVPTAPTVIVPGIGTASAQPSGPFNHRAFWGLMLGLLAILGPLILRASIRTADPSANPSYFPIETAILAATALFVAITGWKWSKEAGGGKGLAITALIVAGLACLFALGAFGATSNNA